MPPILPALAPRGGDTNFGALQVEELPEHLVVGTGAYGQMRPDSEALNELRRRGVGVEALPRDVAVHRYGELDPRRTAAALHLTC